MNNNGGYSHVPLLEDLPPELIGMIGQKATGDALRALRATSRMMCATLEDAFLERFFQRRAHLWTHHSLTVLC